MNAGLISRRYATVLYKFATEQSCGKKVYTDANLILEALTTRPAVMQFLNSPLRKPSEKKQFLATTFEKYVAKQTMQFLVFCIEKERIGMIDDILNVFKMLYKKHLGIKTVNITTANELVDKSTNSITKIVEDKLQSQVEMSFKVDSSIIGGIIIDVDGRQLDCSVSRQLREIEKSLTV